jgi:RHS repeat-associated protein
MGLPSPDTKTIDLTPFFPYGHTYSYGYDGFGNLTSRSEAVPGGYANLKAYIQATGAVPAAADAYINALAFSAQVGTDPVLGPTNRLSSVMRGGGTTGESTQTFPLVYDNSTTNPTNGNLTDDGTFTYAYDPLNRLVAVRKKATAQLVSQHFYNAAGERAGTINYTSGISTGFTQYLRDGAQVVFEKSWTISGTTLTPLGEKVYIGAGALTAMTRQTVSGVTTTSYYGTDHLGTVRATVTVNTSGTETTRSLHDYEPFGVEIVPLQTSSNTHRYTGQERDVLDAASNSTMDYMHFRYLGVGLGRFMRPDNINGSMGNPQSWNLYSYVHGNPVNFNDPTGHMVGMAYRNYSWAAGGIAGSAMEHQEANSWGGGIGLGEHPSDSNPAGVIDWGAIDNVLKVHDDWAGIYAAWRAGSTSGVSSGGTSFSVNAAYDTAGEYCAQIQDRLGFLRQIAAFLLGNGPPPLSSRPGGQTSSSGNDYLVDWDMICSVFAGTPVLIPCVVAHENVHGMDTASFGTQVTGPLWNECTSELHAYEVEIQCLTNLSNKYGCLP